MSIFIKLKTCPKCGFEKQIEQFHKNRTTKDGFELWCKVCKKEDYTQRRARRKEQDLCHCGKPRFEGYKNCLICLNRTRVWGQNNAELKREIQKRGRDATKNKVFDYYGRECFCCKEKSVEFLVIDHIDGGGNKHRKEIGSGSVFYAWLVRNGFPSGFRTLCHNCNGALGHFGYCPHQKTTLKDETTS